MTSEIEIERLRHAVESLHPQQRRLLQLTYPQHGTKDILHQVPDLTPGTIDAYLSKAARALNARNRYHAAELFRQYEQQSVKSEFRSERLSEPQKTDILQRSERQGGPHSEVREVRAEFDYGSDLQALSAMRIALSWVQAIKQSLMLKIGCAVAIAIGLAATVVVVSTVASRLQEMRERTLDGNGG